MDPTDGRSQPPRSQGRGGPRPHHRVRAFLAGDPVPTDADAGTPDQPGSDGWLARLRALFQSRSGR